MPKRYEYEEGRRARENFESGMAELFKVPKSAVPPKKKARKKRARKASGRDLSRDSGGRT